MASTKSGAHTRPGPITVHGEAMFRIGHVDRLPPFLMSIVSGFDHWMFLSSRGALTAGRGRAERCLFPYETDDRLHQAAPYTGPFTMIRVAGASAWWKPFAGEASPQVERNLYKNVVGDHVLFEEIHAGLGLTFTAGWQSSERFGFVRTVRLSAHEGAAPRQLHVIDALQNIMPHGIPLLAQQSMSNLANAYKRSEIVPGTHLGIYSLEALMSDRAEPAESLRASVVWSLGLPEAEPCTSVADAVTHLNNNGTQEKPSASDHKRTGRPGAYALAAQVSVGPKAPLNWRLIADVALSQGDITDLLSELEHTTNLDSAIDQDLRRGSEELRRNVASADGLQSCAHATDNAHHFANVLFNNMRGGVFADNTQVSGADVAAFVQERNHAVAAAHTTFLGELPSALDYGALQSRADALGDPNVSRLTREYLPITFSRRHGDPSRPWNTFEISVRNEAGERQINYQGNWRDIFQNWEALCFSFPEFFESIIAKFVNASTVDGHNPYRVTRQGVEWEVPEPEQPWSNIGYWGDHQIIYLLRLLEPSKQFHPERLQALLHKEIFSYAEVPYRIAPYDDLQSDPRNSISLDEELDAELMARSESIGGDGKLLRGPAGQVLHVSLLEKLLVTALTKISNLVVDGGIWMNTQRPEWNDANNALAGYGLSMVTLYYLRRYLAFVQELAGELESETFELSLQVGQWMDAVNAVLLKHRPSLEQPEPTDVERRQLLDALGNAFSEYRHEVYRKGLYGSSPRASAALSQLCTSALAYVDHSIEANRRNDGLYHAYNLLAFSDDDTSLEVKNLYEMLEGQVAVISSGRLNARETVKVVDGLFASKMYRENQHSFMLYPARQLPSLLDKGVVSKQQLAENPLLTALVSASEVSIVGLGADGRARFNSDFSNAADLARALDRLELTEWQSSAAEHRNATLGLYEHVFQHHAFTGRSGTMYGYEGIGSIYWHMVAKLLLAVQEAYFAAEQRSEDTAVLLKLAEAYYRVRSGLGVSKTPEEYGAFVTDPYSHTPAHAGAQQPGMTGQVKEEILTRRGELGLHIAQGCLLFRVSLLRPAEFHEEEVVWDLFDLEGQPARIPLPTGSLGFTFCQVPIIYRLGGPSLGISVSEADGSTTTINGPQIGRELSAEIFRRSGRVRRIEVQMPRANLLSLP